MPGLQVCALQWSRHEREILSSHGFSQNQLCLWKYPSMAKVAEMSGHTSRVLHLAQSPDGTAVCSAAADETLRFWKCFAEAAPQVKVRPRTRVTGESKEYAVHVQCHSLSALPCCQQCFAVCLAPLCRAAA